MKCRSHSLEHALLSADLQSALQNSAGRALRCEPTCALTSALRKDSTQNTFPPEHYAAIQSFTRWAIFSGESPSLSAMTFAGAEEP